MTTLQLKAELFKELSTIASDERIMKKAIKALKKIIADNNKGSMDETAYIMSSPAMVDILRQGDQEIKEGKGEKVKLEDLWK